MGFFRQLATLALLAGFAHAADLAVLRNGFTIRHATREVIGDNTRLHIDSGGYLDIPTAQIEHFEHDDTPAPQSAAEAVAAPQFQPKAISTATKPQPQPFDLTRAVADASGKHLIDADLIESIIRQESGGKVHARSNKGAQGLMQLMPGTAAKLGVADAYDGNANVEAGTRYFRELLHRYNGDMIKALAAYNAGPQRVDQYKGVPPYTETRRYVAAIVRDFNRKKLAQMAADKKAANATSNDTPRTKTGLTPKAVATSKVASPPASSAKANPTKKSVIASASSPSSGGVQ
jgi:Transglycosylase SLT domain